MILIRGFSSVTGGKPSLAPEPANIHLARKKLKVALAKRFFTASVRRVEV